MIAARNMPQALIDRLPRVRGDYLADAPLANLTWFRVGGPAEVLFHPADEADLAAFMANRPVEMPVTIIGAGSNMLVRDGGVRGVVIQLGSAFANIQVEAGGLIRGGAAAIDVKVASAAREASLSGFEFLRGIPGLLGGAARMNAGAFGGEIKDVFVGARGVDRRGAVRTYQPEDAGFSYRHSAFPEDVILTEICMRGVPGDKAVISARLAEIAGARTASQPVGERTGGSTFRNPSADQLDRRKAWELIDAAGCRGLRTGGAMVSEKHCNFLINCGDATARDLEMLGEEVRRRVAVSTGITLLWEIRRIGVPISGEGTV